MDSDRSSEIENRKKVVKEAPVEDYLLEDPPVYNQNFFILSYLLPNEKNELTFPTIKVRGSFKNQEDCQKRINQLKNVDPYFNMFVCEVGKFGSLLPEDEIKKLDDVDVQYRESILNTMVKEYQENKDKADEEFEKRKQFMKKKAEFEGTKEGQELLSKEKENPIAVRTRIESMSKHLEELQQRINEVNEILSLSNKQLENDYTEDEIKIAEEKYKQEYNENLLIKEKKEGEEIENNDKLFSSEDVFLNRKK